MRVLNKYTAPLGLPGQSKAMGGVELEMGANEVDDGVWSKAKEAAQVQAWIKAGLVVEDAPVEAPKKKG